MQTQSIPVTTTNTFQPVPAGQVRLLPSQFLDRWQLNRQYMLSLKTECLLQNYYLEAGLWQPRFSPENCHGGWESPTCQLRGHFLGHWLSAAAMLTANTGDPEVGGKADYIVSRAGALPEGKWRRMGRFDPREISGLGRPRKEGLGPALHPPQNADGPV